MKRITELLTILGLIFLFSVSVSAQTPPPPAVSVPFDASGMLGQEVADLWIVVNRLTARVSALETDKAVLASRVHDLETARDTTRERVDQLGREVSEARADLMKVIHDGADQLRQEFVRLKSDLALPVAQARDWAKKALLRLGQVAE